MINQLPVIKTNRGKMFFDARCKQLRSKVNFPKEIEFINLTEIDVEYIKLTGLQHTYIIDSFGLVE